MAAEGVRSQIPSGRLAGPDSAWTAGGLAVLAAERVRDRRRLGLTERLATDGFRDRVDVDDHTGLAPPVLAVEELTAESGEVTAVAPEHAACLRVLGEPHEPEAVAARE